MLVAKLKIETPEGALELEAQIWNVSGLSRSSCYDFKVEGRAKSSPDVQLKDYPRWCESTRGLLARCLALTQDNLHSHLPADWVTLRVDIGIRPGGHGSFRALSMASLSRAADDTFNVGFAEDGGSTGFAAGVAPRELYTDAWSLAEHALRVSTFKEDRLPEAMPLDVPVHKIEGLSYICTSDIPEPTRSVFERRMAHSTCPVIPGHPDAVYSWDWASFLGGSR